MSDIGKIRALHTPTVDFHPECSGCDFTGFEGEPPRWPCRTAEIVYTAEEIEAVEAGAKAALAQYRESLKAAPLPRSASVLQQVYAPLIERALRDQPIFKSLP